MNIRCNGHTVSVDGIKELDAANATAFRGRDLRDAEYQRLQGYRGRSFANRLFGQLGTGCIGALRKAAESRNGSVRLLNPTPPVQQIFGTDAFAPAL